MKEKTKFVAFSTQKGGAGKTTLTVLAASYLHYVKGFNVAVIDCDYPQHSIVEMRERDLKLALEDEHYKRLAYEQFTRLQKKAYPVVESNTKEALADADYLLPQGDFDYVFFDLPGTINNEDLIHSLAGMDYLVAPISADRVVMESTLNYAVVVKEHIMGREKSIRLAESREKRLEKVERLEKPKDESAIHFHFDVRRRTGDDVLMIDDMGVEPLMENITIVQWFNLINERQLRGKGTVISTNLNVEELRRRYTERITSRLLDGKQCMLLQFLGDDVRRNKA